MILEHEAVKEIFLHVVKRAKARYDFRIENFCIMGNHFHFIIQPGKGECLSRIMQWILGVFAMIFNRICNLTGHVWGERFFSRIIAGFRQYLRIFMYIDENPASAKLVADPRNWRFGGLWHDREGRRDIVEPSEDWILLQFPNHEQSMLA